MTACGFLLLATVCGYIGMLPEHPLVIHLEGSTVHFNFGWCFWLALIAGKNFQKLIFIEDELKIDVGLTYTINY